MAHGLILGISLAPGWRRCGCRARQGGDPPPFCQSLRFWLPQHRPAGSNRACLPRRLGCPLQSLALAVCRSGMPAHSLRGLAQRPTGRALPLPQVEEACGYVPPTILTSSKNGKGRNELLAHVAQLREFYNKQHHGM